MQFEQPAKILMDYWNFENNRNAQENRKVFDQPFNFQGEGMEVDSAQPSTPARPPVLIQFDFMKPHVTFDTEVITAGKNLILDFQCF